jgi:hypothetical protein
MRFPGDTELLKSGISDKEGFSGIAQQQTNAAKLKDLSAIPWSSGA